MIISVMISMSFWPKKSRKRERSCSFYSRGCHLIEWSWTCTKLTGCHLVFIGMMVLRVSSRFLCISCHCSMCFLAIFSRALFLLRSGVKWTWHSGQRFTFGLSRHLKKHISSQCSHTICANPRKKVFFHLPFTNQIPFFALVDPVRREAHSWTRHACQLLLKSRAEWSIIKSWLKYSYTRLC